MKLEILKDGSKMIHGDVEEIAKLLDLKIKEEKENLKVKAINKSKKKTRVYWTKEEVDHIINKSHLSTSEISKEAPLRTRHTKHAIEVMVWALKSGRGNLSKRVKSFINN